MLRKYFYVICMVVVMNCSNIVGMQYVEQFAPAAGYVAVSYVSSVASEYFGCFLGIGGAIALDGLPAADMYNGCCVGMKIGHTLRIVPALFFLLKAVQILARG